MLEKKIYIGERIKQLASIGVKKLLKKFMIFLINERKVMPSRSPQIELTGYLSEDQASIHQ
jgi:hypothetical protein